MLDSEPKYVISIAARIVGVETYTLRYYERLGLVRPYRSGGKRRYYSEGDLERLHHIKTLVDDLGINLAGVDVVLRMAERIIDLQRQMQEKEAEIKRLREAAKLNKDKNLKEEE